MTTLTYDLLTPKQLVHPCARMHYSRRLFGENPPMTDGQTDGWTDGRTYEWTIKKHNAFGTV